MNKERIPEQNEKQSKAKQYLEQSLKIGGSIYEICNDFNKDKTAKRRELKVRTEGVVEEEDTPKANIRGYIYETFREQGGYLTEEDLEIFNELAQTLSEVPKINVEYTEEEHIRVTETEEEPTQVKYTISPDWEEFED